MTRDEVLALIERAAAEGWTELDLSGAGLRELPLEIGKLQALQSLNLSFNQISEISEVIGRLQALQDLNLHFNQISEIPEVIGRLKALQGLNLGSNQISEIPEVIGRLQFLRDLDLVSNQISEIPEAIGRLKALQKLYLYSNRIRKIPEVIGRLQALQKLNISLNQISEIPEAIGHLKSLQELYIGGNKVNKIPEIVVRLRSLKKLDLGFNKISEIPEAFGRLQALQELYIGGNQISEIPKAIGRLKSLKKLELESNKINEISKAIGCLKSLKILNLSENRIDEIPEIFSHLKALQELYLESNQISEIPEAIGCLKSLKILNLSENKINEIPKAIGHLKTLQELYLGSNQINEIPRAIGHLQSLQYLYLFGNKISEIPKITSCLESLQILDLSENQISNIPIALQEIHNLRELDLRDNDELSIPSEILSDIKNPTQIFNYLRQLRSETKPLNEGKLLLIGQGSVGKTSLVKRLIDNQFDINESQTDGLSVRQWPVEVNDKTVRLNVWDFGGQEIYHATHQFFLTKRSLYLLVCNCRTSEEENRIEYWLKLIQTFGGGSSVIIVGNKKDEQPLDINRRALREKYPNIVTILETSCQTGDGIEDLHRTITTQIEALREVHNRLPLTWFEVKEQLEQMSEDFISYNEYIGICHEHQIPEEQNQEQLIRLLHDLGLVLNFQDHPILKSTNVLNPDWVTGGIYQLLSDETLKTKTKGMLTYDDCERILDPERYPRNRHQFLIELMSEKQFQLCFALPNCPQPRFLVPGLLPRDEPNNTDLDGETLEFQYHYRILPNSVMWRFIVQSHEKIHEQIWWRSGVMLAYREGDEIYNLARIKADIEDKKILIAISGHKQTRRVFLAMIRDTFNGIHNSFANLAVTEWVPVPGYPKHPPLDYGELLGCEAMGKTEYTVGKLRLDIKLRQLLEGYEPLAARQRQHRMEKEGEMLDRLKEGGLHLHIRQEQTQHQGDYQPVSNNIYQNGDGDNVAGDKVMRDKIDTQINNDNRGANIANQVGQVQDHAQVSAQNFTQTTGVSTAELLEIIDNLRQTAIRFPAEQQEDALIDLEDIEEQIQKPADQRNKRRLKKSLTALLTAAAFVASAIATGNDFAGNLNEFTDNVIDLGHKVGIELVLPAGQGE
ncbi:MAG: GTP-binding protein [Spirulina sp. SIO3F2]|nr:GTP-binding protein [Spirulina sp. SIO3F2]